MSAFDAVDGSSTGTEVPWMWVLLRPPRFGGGNMQAITTIGLDIAKSVFQIHRVDAAGNVVVRRQLKRRYVLSFFQKLPPCRVGIEACASSHHWSRELQALGHNGGHGGGSIILLPLDVGPHVGRRHQAHRNTSSARASSVGVRSPPSWVSAAVAY